MLHSACSRHPSCSRHTFRSRSGREGRRSPRRSRREIQLRAPSVALAEVVEAPREQQVLDLEGSLRSEADSRSGIRAKAQVRTRVDTPVRRGPAKREADRPLCGIRPPQWRREPKRPRARHLYAAWIRSAYHVASAEPRVVSVHGSTGVKGRRLAGLPRRTSLP